MPRLRKAGSARPKNDWWDNRVKLRYAAMVRAKGACECCGTSGTPENPLEMDHIKPVSKYPELRCKLDNIQILCLVCNRGKGIDETDWRSIRVVPKKVI